MIRENAVFQIILQVFIYLSKLHLNCYDHSYASGRESKVSAFKWYIIYENIFIFDKVMCKLLRKYKFFSYLHIHTNPQTCLYIFKCHTKLNHFQTPQHLFSKTRQNLSIISTQCGILYFRSSTLN